MDCSAAAPCNVRRSPYVTRACDSCKRRKVKCDAGHPCKNCTASGHSCEHTVVPRKRGRASRRLETQLATTPDETLLESGVSGAALTASPSASDIGFHSASGASHLTSPPAHAVSPSLVLQRSTADGKGIHEQLLEHLALTHGSAEHFVGTCVDLYMQYIFPVTPICHEARLRDGVAIFRADTVGVDMAAVDTARSFALITALCALILSVGPEPYAVQGTKLARIFLRASRAMLLTYLESDLEQPDSTSLVIRFWHSLATQNATGRNGEAHHYHNEASTLALRLRLYEESALAQKTPLESQLLRSIFWQLYLADKSAAVFSDRVCLITEEVFDGELTLLERGSPEVPLLNVTRNLSQRLLSSRFQEGHMWKRRMWRDAYALIQAIKAGRQISDTAQVTSRYIEFAGLTDRFPSWLWSPTLYLEEQDPMDDAEAKCLRTCFWAQRSTIMSSFHVLKLMILQTCMDKDVPGVMGLDRNEISLQQKKMDIGRDFLSELQLVPFDCLKMQGEPTVQRLRKVGAILLELSHHAASESLKTRASDQLGQLLDVLVRLDSLATDDLR